MKRVIMMASIALALVACDKPKTDDSSQTNTTNANTPATTQTTAPAPTAQPVTISDSDLATPADFEDQAEKSITDKTYKAELASIEKDLQKE